MKIGILTFPKAINYGTALQAAALSRVLSEGGHTVEFIDHRCKEIESSNRLFDFSQALNPKYTLAHLINLGVAFERMRNFRQFQKANMVFAADDPYQFDAVVAGSDQIWNYNLTAGDLYYFLNFEKKNTRKVAYAGSFGISEIEEQYRAPLARCFADFDYLSVREQQAAAMIRDIAGIEAPVVLDPTLLLDQAAWSEMADPAFAERGYIFVYTVFNDEKLWNAAQALSQKTGLPIRTISYSKLHRHEAEYSFTAGPAQWLSHMLHAEYVFTNSFHGTAFSVNFQKKFYFHVPENGAKVGSRLLDLTARYGLAGRNIAGEIDESPDWARACALLEQDRALSREFIRRFTSAQ